MVEVSATRMKNARAIHPSIWIAFSPVASFPRNRSDGRSHTDVMIRSQPHYPIRMIHTYPIWERGHCHISSKKKWLSVFHQDQDLLEKVGLFLCFLRHQPHFDILNETTRCAWVDDIHPCPINPTFRVLDHSLCLGPPSLYQILGLHNSIRFPISPAGLLTPFGFTGLLIVYFLSEC